MNQKDHSISFWERGKDYSSIVGIVGFSSDGASFTIKVDVKPHHAYEFLVTDRSFQSADSYPLRPYHVQFNTH
jgi:hypothetical protein